MWSDLLHSRLIIPLFLLAIFSSLAITPVIFYFAQAYNEKSYDIRAEDNLLRDREILYERLSTIDVRVMRLEAANHALQQQVDALTSQLSQVIALTSGKEKKQ